MNWPISFAMVCGVAEEVMGLSLDYAKALVYIP